MDPVDQLAFVVGLTEGEVQAQLGGLVTAHQFHICQRCGAVNLGLARPEKVEIGSVEHQKLMSSVGLPSAEPHWPDKYIEFSSYKPAIDAAWQTSYRPVTPDGILGLLGSTSSELNGEDWSLGGRRPVRHERVWASPDTRPR
jgi:hypothetical protein